MLQNNLIFDIGMHLGEDTDFYLKKGFSIVAFEANPDFVRQCEARFANAIRAGRLHIVSGAVAHGYARTVPFFVNTVETQWGTLNPDWVARNDARGAPSRQIDVERVDIAEAFGKWGTPHYLKIDIEGSDCDVLRAVSTLAERPQFISFETEINSYRRVLEEIELLHSLGYRKFKPVQQKTIEGSHVKLRALDGSDFEHTFEHGASGMFGDDLPGEWLSYRTCRRAYSAIFAKYWAVGHLSPFYCRGWSKRPLRNSASPSFVTASKAQWLLEQVSGVAGWHDLHASL